MTLSHKFHPYVAFWEKGKKKKFFGKEKKENGEKKMSKLTHSLQV